MAGIVVFAYSDVGYECLDVLLQGRHPVRQVFTHSDNAGENIWFRSVRQLAERNGLPVEIADDPKEPWILPLLEVLRPDLIFSFYYRKMIPLRLLATARLGAFNMHGSLLPKFRGRAPINWAVVMGASETGATLHHMVGRADAGDIVDQEMVPIGPDDTAAEVGGRVALAARKVVDRQIGALLSGTAPRRPQNDAEATLFSGRKPDDGRIDWASGAAQVHNLVRAVSHPFPGAFTHVAGQKLFVWRSRRRDGTLLGKPGEVLSTAPLIVGTGDGTIELLRVQLEGEAECDGASAGLTPGMFLT